MSNVKFLICSINQASQVSGIIVDFLSDYDIKVSDKAGLDATVSRIAQEYLSSASNTANKNAPKGKQAAAQPAKKKGGKQKVHSRSHLSVTGIGQKG